MPWGIAAAGAATLAGSAISANAAGNAASTQANAANQASQNQLDMFNKIAGNLSPYMNFGTTAAGNLQNATPGLLSAGTNALPSYQTFNPSDLQNTPGYQFTLNQGLQAAQNGFSAQGLNNSGAASKGASQYAAGLASTTYNQQLQNYMAQQGQQYNQGLSTNAQEQNQALNQYNMLFGQTQLGENAAAMQGNLGTQATSAANNYLTSGAAASAAGGVGQANALSSGLGNLGNLGILSQYLNNGSGGISGSSNANSYGTIYGG